MHVRRHTSVGSTGNGMHECVACPLAPVAGLIQSFQTSYKEKLALFTPENGVIAKSDEQI